MRNRVVAGVALVAIGVGAYLILQPGSGAVAYHKRKYLEVWDRMNGMDWQGQLGDRLGQQIGIRPPILYASKRKRKLLAEELQSHRDMLVQLGYLGESWVVFSNRSVPTMSMLTNWPPEQDYRFVEFFYTYSADQTNTIKLIAPVVSIKSWEDYFQKYDLPDSGKKDQFVPHP